MVSGNCRVVLVGSSSSSCSEDHDDGHDDGSRLDHQSLSASARDSDSGIAMIKLEGYRIETCLLAPAGVDRSTDQLIHSTDDGEGTERSFVFPKRVTLCASNVLATSFALVSRCDPCLGGGQFLKVDGCADDKMNERDEIHPPMASHQSYPCYHC